MARVIFFSPFLDHPPSSTWKCCFLLLIFSFGWSTKYICRKELQAFNIQTSRARSLIGPPPSPSPSPLAFNVMLAPSQADERLETWTRRAVSWAVDSLSVRMVHNAPNCWCFFLEHFLQQIFNYIFDDIIIICCCFIRPTIGLFSTMCALVILDPLG